MLGHLRVIDLTGGSEQICGQILGDLGADVVLVEPAGGSATRSWAPFAGDEPGPDRSLVFWAYNRNKRSVMLDLKTDQGVDRLRTLLADADIVIESFAPGYLRSIGLGYEGLATINPAIVLVSISPFGQSGPKAGWAASDLTVVAASGTLQITGDDDRAPCRLSVPQAFLHAGAEAAVGALIAHAAAARDGVGQQVDVSAQAATAMATQSWILQDAWAESELVRIAGGVKFGPLRLRFVNPCKDGFVSVTFLFGSAIGPFSRRLMEVLFEEGFVDAATRDKDWLNYTTLLTTGDEPLSELDRCIECITSWTMTHTKDELFALALERGLLIVPVATTRDVIESPQLSARGYWRTLDSPLDASPVTVPGPFARFSETPMVNGRRPPRLGEHSSDIAPRSKAKPPTVQAASPSLAKPLEGLRVLDFMWVMAGPASTRYLADYGATVVRVESSTRVDTARTIGPFKDGVPGGERSALFAAMNAGKFGLTLNPKTPEGHELAMKLVAWADVVAESFSPKAMRSWGLDYDALRKVNPGIIVISSCLNGQTGPHCSLAGFGTMGAQLAGFGELGGWPDRPPAGPFAAYTDYVSPKFTAAALLAALEHRRLTGEGQYIDVSQAEASLHFLGPALLDYTVNGRVATRMGNQSREWAPHAVFPCTGDDRWIAIAAETDAQWQALCTAIGRGDWATDAALGSAADRLRRRDELEIGVAAWTATRTQDEVEVWLQAAHVPCHRSSRSSDALADRQLAHRGHFATVDHAEFGPVQVEGSRIVFSRTPAVVTRAGPTLGQDNDYVLREILGLDNDEIVRLVSAGALE